MPLLKISFNIKGLPNIKTKLIPAKQYKEIKYLKFGGYLLNGEEYIE